MHALYNIWKSQNRENIWTERTWSPVSFRYVNFILSSAGAVAFGYSNIFVTSPSPENLNTLFEFVLKGLNTMGYEEHLNYQVLRSADQQFNKCVMRIVVTRERQQVIQVGGCSSVCQPSLCAASI